MGLGLPCRGWIAGPGIPLGLLHHIRANGIQDHVPADFQKMAVLLNQDRLVPALKEMPCPAMPFVEELGIDAIQLPHAYGEIAVRSLDEQMIMIGHEAVGMTDPIVALIDMLEGVQEILPVPVVLEYGLLFIAAGGYVIDCAGIFNAEGAGHGLTVTEKSANVKPQDLTLKGPLCAGGEAAREAAQADHSVY